MNRDLSQFCLEPDPAESNQALAWVNAICFIYLVIGVLSLKPVAPVIHRAASAALEAAPTIIEPLVNAALTDAAPRKRPARRTPKKAVQR